MGIVVKSLSFSTVKEFTEGCPEKLFLDKIDHRPKRGVSANLIMGSAIHAAAEAYYRGLMLGHRFNADTLFRVFTARWGQTPEQEIIYTKKTHKEIFEKANQLIDLLVESKVPQILAVEKSISFQLTDGLTVIGKPDLVFRDEKGILTIVDLKTSARAYGEDEIHNASCQTFTYAMALPEKVKLRLMLFVKTKEPRIDEIELNPDDVDINEWRSKFIMTKRGIEQGIRFRVRSWKCKTCQFSYICNEKTEESVLPEMKEAA